MKESAAVNDAGQVFSWGSGSDNMQGRGDNEDDVLVGRNLTTRVHPLLPATASTREVTRIAWQYRYRSYGALRNLIRVRSFVTARDPTRLKRRL
jgi:hypothetical protein